jgi:hypothetical protein
MEINENSWHYKLYNLSYRVWNDYPPTRSNLCQYLRHTVFCLLGCLIFWGLLVSGIGSLLFVLAVGAYHHPLITLLFVGSIAAIIGILYLIFRVNDSELFHAWIDSKTKGICPTITFKRDNNAD